MPEARRNAKRRNIAGFRYFLEKSPAQPVRFPGAEAQNPARLVLCVETMRAARFERHDLELERARPEHRRDAAARQRMQRIERVVRRLAEANLIRASHGVTPERDTAAEASRCGHTQTRRSDRREQAGTRLDARLNGKLPARQSL